MLKNYFKTAWRNIVSQRLNSVINIGSLSVAMTAVVIIVIWVQNELSFDNFHKDVDRIYVVKNYDILDKNQTWVEENSFYPLAEAMQRTLPEIEKVTHIIRPYTGEVTFNIDGKLYQPDHAVFVDSNWFSFFHYTFIAGNAASFYAHPNSLVLTEPRAIALFGKTNAVGNTVKIDSVQYTVQAVVKDNPVNSSFQYDVIMSPEKELGTKERLDNQNYWVYLAWKTFVKLKPGADAQKATAKINALIKANNKGADEVHAGLLPLKSWHFDNTFESSSIKHGNSKTITIFSVLAFLLLLAASINYVNLSVARTGVRLKEMSIRKINGATRLHLFTQMMAESVVTGIISLLLTVFLAYLFFPVLRTFTGSPFVFNPFNPVVLLILVGTLVSIILLTGIYPALLLSSFSPVSLFRGVNVLGLKNSSFKKVLVTSQFALAVFMVISAIVVYRQLTFIQTQDVAYNRAQVFTVKIPSNAFDFSQKGAEEKQESVLSAIKQDLLAKSQVQTVVRTNISSLVNENFTTAGGVNWDGMPKDFNPSYISYAAEADINNIMHFKMAAGRWFDVNNPADKNNTVLNETAVKQFGLKEPIIGKRFNKGVIIGVAKDFFYKSMHEKIGPLVMSTRNPLSGNFMVQAKAGKTKEALSETEAIWKKYFPGEIFSYAFTDEEFDKLYQNDRKALTFTMIFAGLSILICCMGLLGMTVFMAEQRRKEIGIRKVLGATVASIVALVSKDFLKLVLISIVVASPVAWYAMNSWLQDYAYRTDISAWVFVIAGAVAVAIATATIGYQAVKAALANPVKSLKVE